jgi:hypothetical protein
MSVSSAFDVVNTVLLLAAIRRNITRFVICAVGLARMDVADCGHATTTTQGLPEDPRIASAAGQNQI